MTAKGNLGFNYVGVLGMHGRLGAEVGKRGSLGITRSHGSLKPRKLAIIVKHGTFGNIGSHGNVGPSAATAPSASSVASASSRRQVRNHGNITNVGNAQASTYAQTRTERTRTRSSPISCLLYSDELVFKIQGPLFVLFPDFWMATRHLMYNVQVLVTAIASPRHAP